MYSRNVLARSAGLLYLLLIVCGVAGLMYVPATLVDWDDPAATAANIRNADGLFRLGIISSAVGYTSFLVMGIVLFELLKTTNVLAARMMLGLVSAGATIGILNAAMQANVLTLLAGHDYLAAFSADEVNARVMYLLAAGNNVYDVANILWGLWLLPFGYLVYRSGFLPRILGAILMLACFDYLATLVLRVQFGADQIPAYLSITSSIGEFGICLWLLIAGARPAT